MKFIVIFAVLSVMLVLSVGLTVMMKGDDPRMSNKLMQLRVAVQAVAIVVIMAALWLGGQSSDG